MDCSVIICTYNRASILRENLLTLQQQAYDRGKLEILVVDNCSGDDTPAVARMFANNGRYPVRYVYEARQGLSYARNCGSREARGEIVIFLDDDALPEKNTWVANLINAFRDPQVGAVGGDIHLRWPAGGRPDWVHDFLLPNLGKTMFDHQQEAALHYPNYPWGGNIAFRKAHLQQVNGFSPQLGRNGEAQLSGEETEVCLRLEAAGKEIRYVPDAAVAHIVAPERLTRDWFHRRAHGQGLSDAYIARLHAGVLHGVVQLMRNMLRAVIYLAGKTTYMLIGNPRMVMYCSYQHIFSRAYVMRMLNLR